LPDEHSGEVGRVRERHHVAGSLDDVHRHGHRRQRACSDGRVEEHVPEVSSRALPNVAHDGMDLVGIVVECAMSWKARAAAAPEGINGDQSGNQSAEE
jgi:hypothetical protein